MKILDAGHRYRLEHLKCDGGQMLDFYKDAAINGDGRSGCSSQEVLRALIDRVAFLDNQQPCEENRQITRHLRQALLIFETRAIRRKIDNDEKIENYALGGDGHWTHEI